MPSFGVPIFRAPIFRKPIFDHYLSEYGNSVSLLIHPETKKVKVGRRHSWDEKEFTYLEGAFNYMKRERYYE